MSNRRRAVLFTLTMPSNNSWNGKWTGDGEVFAISRNVPESDLDTVIGSHTYNFGDGWVARVSAEVKEASERRAVLRKSGGFCGYDWMVDSILKHGKIIDDQVVVHRLTQGTTPT